MSYRGRFAPSPTGPLHFGSLVAAVASWLDARAVGGAWLVRMEDVDIARTVPGAADEILRALEALGLGWDEEVAWQSRRTDLYEAALEALRDQGAVYRCRCSRREVADSALQGIEGAVYPGTCRRLALSTAEPCAERFEVQEAIVSFDDRAQGPVRQDVARDVGDFVLRRRDGLHAYQLAVVVDDAEQRISDVVRGADLLASTPRQILLQRALGLPTPRYLHVPVVTDAHGEKLSKQSLAPAVDANAAGTLLHAALEFLGQPRPDSGIAREILVQAARDWDPARIPRRRDAPFPRGAAAPRGTP